MKREVYLSLTLRGNDSEVEYRQFVERMSEFDKSDGFEPFHFVKEGRDITVRAHTMVDEDTLFTIIENAGDRLCIESFSLHDPPTLEQRKEMFSMLLDSHNWYFTYSNDDGVWQKGNRSYALIDNFLRYNPEKVFSDMYDEADPFTNNKTII